jgi:hypothetical protein
MNKYHLLLHVPTRKFMGIRRDTTGWGKQVGLTFPYLIVEIEMESPTDNITMAVQTSFGVVNCFIQKGI